MTQGSHPLASLPVHLREGTRILLRRPLASLVAVLALGLGLVVVALAAWALIQVGHFKSSLDQDLRLHAALSPTLDEAQTRALLERIAADDAVRSVRWVGPQEQRGELEAILGKELLEGLDDAVFPAGGMAEIALTRAAVTTPDGLAAFLERVKSIESIDGIDAFPFDSRHIKVLLDASEVTRIAGLLLGLIALLAGGLAVYLLIQLAHAASAPTIELLRAFGATDGFIRGRFFFAALLIGLAGAGVGVGLGVFVDAPLSDLVSIVPSQGEGLGGPFDLVLLGWCLAGGLLVSAAACWLALAHKRTVTVRGPGERSATER